MHVVDHVPHAGFPQLGPDPNGGLSGIPPHEFSHCQDFVPRTFEEMKVMKIVAKSRMKELDRWVCVGIIVCELWRCK